MAYLASKAPGMAQGAAPAGTTAQAPQIGGGQGQQTPADTAAAMLSQIERAMRFALQGGLTIYRAGDLVEALLESYPT